MLLNDFKDMVQQQTWGKTKCIGRHPGTMANEHITVGSNSYENVKTFKQLDSSLVDQNYIQDEIKRGLEVRKFVIFNPDILSSRILYKNFKINTHTINNIASCIIWFCDLISYIKEETQAKGLENKIRRRIFRTKRMRRLHNEERKYQNRS